MPVQKKKTSMAVPVISPGNGDRRQEKELEQGLAGELAAIEGECRQSAHAVAIAAVQVQ